MLKRIQNKNFIKTNQKKIFLKQKEEICKLPFLITKKSDFYIASILISKANFITDKKIESQLFKLDKSQKTKKN